MKLDSSRNNFSEEAEKYNNQKQIISYEYTNDKNHEIVVVNQTCLSLQTQINIKITYYWDDEILFEDNKLMYIDSYRQNNTSTITLNSLPYDSYTIQDFKIPLFEESDYACSQDVLDRSAENDQSIKSASNSDMYEHNNQICSEPIKGCDLSKLRLPNEAENDNKFNTNPHINSSSDKHTILQQSEITNDNMESSDSANLTPTSEPPVSNSVTAQILFREQMFNQGYLSNLPMNDQERDSINQIKKAIENFNETNVYEDLYELINLLLNDKDNLLLALFGNSKTQNLMIQLIDCLVKKKFSLINGHYEISLCKSDNVNYINDIYEKENSISMVINSQLFNNKFLHPKAGFTTEFLIRAENDNSQEMTFQDTSVVKPRNQPLGQFYDPELRTLYLTIKKQQGDKFQFEQMQDDKQIIVQRKHNDINFDNLDKMSTQQILGFNIETNTFESVNLEVAMFRDDHKQLYLFKFTNKDTLSNPLNVNTSTQVLKEQAQLLLNQIQIYILSFGLDFFTNKQCCAVYKKFAEFMSFRTNDIVKEHFTLLLNNQNQINTILENYEGTQIYLTLISRKFYQFYYRHAKESNLSQFHQQCMAEMNAQDFNKVNSQQINLFLKQVQENIDKQGQVRNLTVLLEYIVKYVDQSLIKGTFINQILENFDTIVGSQEGIRTEGLRVFGIVLSKLPEPSDLLEQSIERKILKLATAKDMSIMIQKMIEMEETMTLKQGLTSNVEYQNQPVYVKTIIFKIITQDYHNHYIDPVFIFMGDSIANYVLQTIYKSAELIEKNQGQQLFKHKILIKIDQFQQQYQKFKKNKQAKSIFKNQHKKLIAEGL